MVMVLANRLGDQLKNYIRVIESLEQEKNEISSAIKETMSEAKREGLDVKTIKRILTMRKLGRVDFEERESILHTYMSALGMK